MTETATTATPLDLDALRAETAGVAHCLHLNNAGAALPPDPVVAAVTEYQETERLYGGYEAAAAHADGFRGYYDALADMLGCDTDEVAFQESASAGLIRCIQAMPFADGDRILTAAQDYPTNIMTYGALKRRADIAVDIAPLDADGTLDPAAIEARLTARTRLIVLTHLASTGGAIMPAAEIGRIARTNGIPYLIDACQTAGQLPLDVGSLGCDMLVFSARKFLRGPRGTGGVFVRRDFARTLVPMGPDLGALRDIRGEDYALIDGARKLEVFERHFAGQIGMAEAVRYYLRTGPEAIRDRIHTLAGRLRTELADIRGVRSVDDGPGRAGLVSVWLNDIEPLGVLKRLRRDRVHVSHLKPHYAPVHAGLQQAGEGLRVSPHYYNSDDEIEEFVPAFAQALKDSVI